MLTSSEVARNRTADVSCANRFLCLSPGELPPAFRAWFLVNPTLAWRGPALVPTVDLIDFLDYTFKDGQCILRAIPATSELPATTRGIVRAHLLSFHLDRVGLSG